MENTEKGEEVVAAEVAEVPEEPLEAEPVPEKEATQTDADKMDPSQEPEPIQNGDAPVEASTESTENEAPPDEENTKEPEKAVEPQPESIEPQRESIEPQRESIEPQRESIEPQRESVEHQREAIESERESIEPPREFIEPQNESIELAQEQSEEVAVRTTRSSKRKANDSDYNDNSKNAPSNETTGQKENGGLKKDDNVQKDSNSQVSIAENASLKPLSASEVMGKGKRARIPNKKYSDIVLSPNRRGLKAAFDTSDLEGGARSDLLEAASGGPSLPKRNRSSLPKENLQDPKYFKPFKYGWRRELVWRSTTSDTRKKGNIYYYTPSGKKVRTFRELSDHLTGKNLTLDNFSFTKELLGIDDPLKELSRDASYGKSDSRSGSETPPLPSKKAKKAVSPKNYDSDASKSDARQSAPSRRRTAGSSLAQISDNSEAETETSIRKAGKMSLRKGRAPPAKKSRLANKNEDSVEVETLPSAVRTSPRKTRASQRSRNLKVTSITNSSNSSGPDERNEAKFMENYMQNVSFGYNTLLHVFQYLKVQDLLRAGCVCAMWRDIASHHILWRTVRMKNSQVHSFEGLANALKKHGTVHLDLRKMLLPSTGDDIWPEFSKAISRVDTLRKIELCRCPSSVVEELTTSNPYLEVINAVTIKCESLNLDPFNALKCIRELKLKSTCGLSIKSIDSLKGLKTLKILSLTSVTDLHKLDLTVMAELVNLEALDLGECTDFPKSFGSGILLKLHRLEKLRLEKGQGSCHTFDILEAVKDMERLEQLELVNFDVKTGFDKAIGLCRNIKKLMIIPTYISQSATTNNMVLSGVLQLHGNLSHFVWGVTLELLRVTELFVDQCEDSNKKEKKPGGNGDCIPVLKPVPDLSNGGALQAASNPPQVEILPLPNLQKLLLNSLPTTRVKILKIPFHATWRQTLSDTV